MPNATAAPRSGSHLRDLELPMGIYPSRRISLDGVDVVSEAPTSYSNNPAVGEVAQAVALVAPSRAALFQARRYLWYNSFRIAMNLSFLATAIAWVARTTREKMR